MKYEKYSVLWGDRDLPLIDKNKKKTKYLLQQFKNICYVTHHSRTRNSIKI